MERIDSDDNQNAALDEGRVQAEQQALESEGADASTLREIIESGDSTAERLEAAKRLLREYGEEQIKGASSSFADRAQDFLKRAA